MAAPIVTIDKPNGYAPGDKARVTIKTPAGARDRDLKYPLSVIVEGLGESEPTFLKVDMPPAGITIQDPAHVWVKVSDDETTAVYETTV